MNISVRFLFIFMFPIDDFIINQKIKNFGYNGLIKLTMCVCVIYIYIYIYIHTHTHIFNNYRDSDIKTLNHIEIKNYDTE